MLTECEGDIARITEREVSTATREEILANPICSLNGKDYNKKVIVPGDGFKLVKLEELTDIKKQVLNGMVAEVVCISTKLEDRIRNNYFTKDNFIETPIFSYVFFYFIKKIIQFISIIQNFIMFIFIANYRVIIGTNANIYFHNL